MSEMKIWVTNPLERIRKDCKAKSVTDYALFAAKNEYESFQIIINAGDSAVTVENIEFSDFVTSDGKVLSDCVTVYREHYVEIVKNSPSSCMVMQEIPGLIPDALIPAIHPKTGKPLSENARFRAFPYVVEQNAAQPYFIDVHIPSGTADGFYTAEYTVVTDKGNFKGNLSLTVWDVELPKEQVQKSLFGGWSGTNRDKAEVAAQHRMFMNIADKEHQEYLYNNYGYNIASIGFWSGADIDTCKMKEAPDVEDIKARKATYFEKLDCFAYTADEIGHCKALYKQLIEWGQAMHKAGVKQFVVMPPMKELFDDGLGEGRSAVDIWVVLPKQYDGYKPNVDEAIRKGDSVWTYNCLVQDNYSPKWLLDYPLINFRIHPGFINYSIKSEGFLFWVADNYKNREDVWTRLNDKFDAEVWNGDGILFYPGDELGIEDSFVPSLRAKAIRDGFEDYELCNEIARRGKGALAQSYSESIGKDFTNWTQDNDVLLSNRVKLGEAFRLGGKR